MKITPKGKKIAFNTLQTAFFVKNKSITLRLRKIISGYS